MRASLPLLLLAFTQPVLLSAGRRVSAAEIIDEVSVSFYTDHDDDSLARQLRHLEMTEQLSPHIVQYFRFIGVGPKSLRQLELLRDNSLTLSPPANLPFSIQPVPDDAGQHNLEDRLLRYAQSYIQTLPDLICNQTTRRFTNGETLPSNGRIRFGQTMIQSDHFSRTLRFIGGKEQPSLTRTTGNLPGDAVENAGRIITSGEFGGDLVILFGPNVKPKISWDHWERVKNGRTAVLRYAVGAQSHYTLEYCCLRQVGSGSQLAQTFSAPVTGLVYIDPDSGAIARLTIRAIHVPATFPIKESNSLIDYGPVSLGGRMYMLPSRAIVFSRMESGQKNRNEIAFNRYRKFEAESTLSFPQGETTHASSEKP